MFTKARLCQSVFTMSAVLSAGIDIDLFLGCCIALRFMACILRIVE